MKLKHIDQFWTKGAQLDVDLNVDLPDYYTRSDSPVRMGDSGATKWSGGIKKGGSTNDGAKGKATAMEANA